MQQPNTAHSDHDALLSLEVDEWVTVIAPRVWAWHTDDMLSGEFLIAEANTNADAYLATSNENAESSDDDTSSEDEVNII